MGNAELEIIPHFILSLLLNLPMLVLTAGGVALLMADILLAPSITDANGDTEGGAPVSIVEALIAGVPVVGTNHCDIPNVVTHGETGLLCEERDVEALADNLAQLADNGKLREQMGKQAYETAPRKHDIRVRVKEILKNYQMVL